MCRLRAQRMLLGCLAALGLFGCGDESEPAEPQDQPSETGCGKPIHAIATNVPTSDDGASMFLTTVCGLDQDLTLDDAVELPGGGRMYVYQDKGMIVLHSFETNELTRLDVARDGKITVGPKLGLGSYGAVFANINHFVSDTKAIMFDTDGSRAILYNPTEMILLGDFPLPTDTHPGYIINGWYPVQVAPDQIMIPVEWINWDNYHVWPKASALIVDTANDAVTDLIERDGCPSAIHPSALSSGDRIFANDTYSVYFNWWDRPNNPSHSCAIRAPAGGTGLDGEIIDLKAFTGGRPTGSLKVDANDIGYLAAYYAEVGDAVADFDERMTLGSAWRVWRVHPDDSPPSSGEEVAGIPGVGGIVSFVRLAGVLYVVVTEDGNRVVLYELPPTGPAKRALSMPGIWAYDVMTVWN